MVLVQRKFESAMAICVPKCIFDANFFFLLSLHGFANCNSCWIKTLTQCAGCNPQMNATKRHSQAYILYPHPKTSNVTDAYRVTSSSKKLRRRGSEWHTCSILNFPFWCPRVVGCKLFECFQNQSAKQKRSRILFACYSTVAHVSWNARDLLQLFGESVLRRCFYINQKRDILLAHPGWIRSFHLTVWFWSLFRFHVGNLSWVSCFHWLFIFFF